MAEELGQIQRPSASQYDGRRKLLLVPLIYGPQADDEEGAAGGGLYAQHPAEPRP